RAYYSSNRRGIHRRHDGRRHTGREAIGSVQDGLDHHGSLDQRKVMAVSYGKARAAIAFRFSDYGLSYPDRVVVSCYDASRMIACANPAASGHLPVLGVADREVASPGQVRGLQRTLHSLRPPPWIPARATRSD